MAQQTNRRTFLVGASAAAAAAALPLGAAGPASAAPRRRSAATVLHNGVIFTGRPGCRPAQALAVGRDGTILAVGSHGEVRRFLGRDTEVVDLKGGFVMPGLHDGHAHPASAGLALHSVSLGGAELTIPQIQAVLTSALNASADKEPDGWLEVSAWNSTGVLPAGTVVTKADLDALATKRPVFVRSADYHNAWVNSRALALAGITKDTPDPDGGTIVRNASGEPTGLLKDTAAGLVGNVIPEPTLAERVAAAGEAFAMLAGAGVTSVMDAATGDDSADLYKALAAAGKLKLRTRLAYRLSAQQAKDPQAALATLRAFEKSLAGADLLSTRTAKVFMDGVMEYPAHTAAMLDPYLVNTGTDTSPRWEPGTDYGSLYFDQDTITGLAVVLDRAGWQLHAHTIGDRAVRTALTAYEAAVRRGGRHRDNRHTLAHIELIAPSDIRRLARARVLACLQLQWAEYDSYTTDSLLPYIGAERQARIYPARTMERAGVRLTGGTDWPIDDFNPWRPVDQAITRTGSDGTAFHPEEGLSRLSSLRMHTYGSAYQLHQEHLTGTLEVGKQADLVHTDRDLLKIKASEIRGTQAEFTMIGGEIVHDPASATAATRTTHASIAAAKALRATGATCRANHSHLACGH